MPRSGQLVVLFGISCILALALLAWPVPTLALERSAYTIEILVDGRPLPEYAARGTTYVEALAGREYAIRLRNVTGERIAVALAVDGLNSIDARVTSASEASKWILAPWETVTIDGWQTSSATARRFFFTTEERSYGDWLGETSNLGIVSAAVFREKHPRPIAHRQVQTGGRSERSERRGAEGAAPSSPTETRRDELNEEAGSDSAAEPDLAATGIGREIDHQVRRVSFEAESTPVAVLEVRYEYQDALVKLGVLPRPADCVEDALLRRERARGFSDAGFAPDPFRCR